MEEAACSALHRHPCRAHCCDLAEPQGIERYHASERGLLFPTHGMRLPLQDTPQTDHLESKEQSNDMQALGIGRLTSFLAYSKAD